MKVICYGDSNTFGYDPRSYLGGRYGANSRWVDILAVATGWEVHNNGMNGREISCKETIISKSTDLLIVMLGTNDLLQGNDVHIVTERMDRFMSHLEIDKDKILLVAPPPLQFGEWVSEQKIIDASAALREGYFTLAKRLGIRFTDAGNWGVSISFDGVHFTEDGHKSFAEGLIGFLKTEGLLLL